jgi:molybdopterin-guanine dinucleotide biosynthesis protein A
VTLAGIFVGGAGTRMGGVAKGLLAAPGGEGSLIDRWRAVLAAAGVDRVLLVGRHPAYAEVAALEAIDDDPPGIGPLGGLIGLLRRAGEGTALAFACDMPFVSPGLVERLVGAPPAPIVAPRRGGRWEPLCARYEAPRVLPFAVRAAAGERHGLQRVLDEAGAVELALAPSEAAELHDWDTPDDRR